MPIVKAFDKRMRAVNRILGVDSRFRPVAFSTEAIRAAADAATSRNPRRLIAPRSLVSRRILRFADIGAQRCRALTAEKTKKRRATLNIRSKLGPSV